MHQFVIHYISNILSYPSDKISTQVSTRWNLCWKAFEPYNQKSKRKYIKVYTYLQTITQIGNTPKSITKQKHFISLFP